MIGDLVSMFEQDRLHTAGSDTHRLKPLLINASFSPLTVLPAQFSPPLPLNNTAEANPLEPSGADGVDLVLVERYWTGMDGTRGAVAMERWDLDRERREDDERRERSMLK